MEKEHTVLFRQKEAAYERWKRYRDEGLTYERYGVEEEIKALQAKMKTNKTSIQALVDKAGVSAEGDDLDYVFITWVMRYLPVGIVGLLFAVIFSGAMSSTSAELNALASTTTVDFYKRLFNTTATDQQYVWWSKGFTVLF